MSTFAIVIAVLVVLFALSLVGAIALCRAAARGDRDDALRDRS